MSHPSILVVTVVHTPLDARIHHRQIRALRDAGFEVTYAAPWSATSTPRTAVAEGVRAVDLPRAAGRRRLGPLLRARRLVRTAARHHDLILLHDPELLLAVAGQLRRLPPVALDVHEDTAAALIDRPWLPRAARPLVAWAVRRLEAWAERRMHLLLAEKSYQHRFRALHPFVPNVPPRPNTDPQQPGDHRVVYLGRIARSRGAIEILSIAEALHGEFTFEMIGEADAEIEPLLRSAVDAGHVTWSGFLPNEQALSRIEGAMAGLSLVHPQPNHAGSLQTKVLEYLSRRIPVISTDLPVTGQFVRDHQVGLTVAPHDIQAAIDAIRRLRESPAERCEMAERGFELVRDELNWERAGQRFVKQIHAWAAAGSATIGAAAEEPLVGNDQTPPAAPSPYTGATSTPNRRTSFVRLLHLFPTGTLVDLGAGHGGFARAAANLGWTVTAVDARDERWPQDERITWIRSDIRHIDLTPYDLISCLGLFYHLTCQDQLDLLHRASGRPLIIDTHLDHGAHRHRLSDRVTNDLGYEGRYYQEPGRATSSWQNDQSFWPTLSSFHHMLEEHGYPTLLAIEPWYLPDRTFFLALPDR